MMIHFLFILLLGLTTPEFTHTEGGQLPTTTYRSDQFSPGLISEYMKVTYSEDRSKIEKIEYWYTYRDNNSAEKSEMYTLKFRKGEQQSSSEEVYNKGEVLLPSDEDYTPFHIAEGMFDLKHEPDRIQTFEVEM